MVESKGRWVARLWVASVIGLPSCAGTAGTGTAGTDTEICDAARSCVAVDDQIRAAAKADEIPNG